MNLHPVPPFQETLSALKWISEIMKQNKIAYQIVGGLAARAYGAQRPIVDIDILVPFEALTPLASEMNDHLEYLPKHHLSEQWDITYMALNYGLQRIEIGDGEGAKIFDRSRREWRSYSADFSHPHWIDFHEIRLPFLEKARLLEYKRILSREVDLQDLAEMKNSL